MSKAHHYTPKQGAMLSALAIGLTAACANLSPTANAEDITLKGAEALSAMQKMICSTTEKGIARYGFFEGRAYSRVPGEKDRHLFDVMGINVRQCNTLVDETRGRGFRSVSREIMVYMDPDTGEILDLWRNPWTGEMIEVMHVANDPVNMREYRYERIEDSGELFEISFRKYGEHTVSSVEVPLLYSNPLGGEYQDYVGGRYHAMEIFNDFYDSEKLLDPGIVEVGNNQISWTRVAQWLPWMEMSDRAGLMIFNATGYSTLNWDELPARVTELVDARYPDYKAPPPLDDARENQTSWTVFKRKLEEKDRAE